MSAEEWNGGSLAGFTAQPMELVLDVSSSSGEDADLDGETRGETDTVRKPISAEEPEIEVVTSWSSLMSDGFGECTAAEAGQHLHFPAPAPPACSGERADEAGRCTTQDAAVELFRSKYPVELVQLATIFSKAECSALIQAAEGYGFGRTKCGSAPRSPSSNDRTWS